MKNQAKAIIASPPRPAPPPIPAFMPRGTPDCGEDKDVGVLEDVRVLGVADVGVLDNIGLGGPEVLFGSRALCISNVSDQGH